MDIYERINTGEFKTKLEYGNCPAKPTPPSSAGDASDFRQYANDLGKWEYKIKEFEGKAKLVREDQSRLDDLFCLEVLKANGIALDHPKALKLYWKAWDRGHSGGHHEVALVISDLAELIL